MQQLNPSEISDIIKQRIENLDIASQAQNEGTIIGVSDGIIRIHGLAEAQYGEMIERSAVARSASGARTRGKLNAATQPFRNQRHHQAADREPRYRVAGAE